MLVEEPQRKIGIEYASYFGKLIKIITEKAVQLHDILINYINVLKNCLLFLKVLNKMRWGYK